MSEKNQLSEDQISFSGFERWLRHFLRSFFWFLSYLQLVLFKSRWHVLIGLVCGLALGYFYHVSRPVHYKVSMVVEFNELSKKTFAEMIDQLNSLSGSPSLATELKLSPEIAGAISSINARDMNDDPLALDTSTRKWQPFKIVVWVRNSQPPDTLENAIVNYLNNTPFLKKIKREQRKITIEKLAFVDGDLRKMDSLKIAYNQFLTRPNSATFYNNAFNPAELYEQSALLAKEKEILSRWLAMDTAAVNIIDRFKVSSSPQSMSLTKSLLVLGGLGFLIGYLIGFMQQTKKLVNR